jgi:hypothetical protein
MVRLALIDLLAGCGEGSPEPTEQTRLSVSVNAEWPVQPASAAELGYILKVDILNNGQNHGASMLVNGTQVELVADGDLSSLSHAQVGLAANNEPVSITVQGLGQDPETAVFRNLTPGVAATLLAPPELHAGDDIVILPVADVAGETGHAAFYPLDDPTWQPWGIAGTTERRLDGLHVQVPSITGRAVLAVWGTGGNVLSAESSCPGFAWCEAESSDALGPFSVTVAP